jgi:hypothetical protein
MKLLLVAAALVVTSTAFAQFDGLKEKALGATKKVCKQVNGKEVCTVKEVQGKVEELKLKLNLKK